MKPAPRAMRTAMLETTWGAIRISTGSQGVHDCTLPHLAAGAARRPFRVLRLRLPPDADARLRRAAAFARAMVEGRDPGSCPRLDEAILFAPAPFRRAAWRALRGIPRGRTITYGELARRAGRPGAARAAGGACGANPLPLFVPCHRVTAANGQPGGFTGGLGWKRLLLAGEGVAL